MNKLLSTAVLLAGMALATNASAATFTSDHCTDGCGGDGTAFATITGTQINANTVDIAITPLNGNLDHRQWTSVIHLQSDRLTWTSRIRT